MAKVSTCAVGHTSLSALHTEMEIQLQKWDISNRFSMDGRLPTAPAWDGSLPSIENLQEISPFF